MKYKMIATDMDGTLLNSDLKISEENIESIIKAQEEGVVFVLASGRPTFAMEEYAKILKLHEYGGYILSFNGGEIKNCKTNEVIFRKGLNEDQVKLVYDISKKLNASFVTYNDNIIYGTKFNEYIENEVVGTKMEFREIKDINEVDFSKTIKCMLLNSEEKVKILEKELKKEYNDEFFIAISNPIFLEVANKDVNKGKTLEFLANKLNISTNEIIGVGDSYNDILLLKQVGMPVAVENAVDDIKKISKFVATNNNNSALKSVIDNFIVEKEDKTW